MLNRANFNKTQYWSECEATPRYKLRFKASEGIESDILHEIFLRLLSLLPKEDFGHCRLSYGKPVRSMVFSHSNHPNYFKTIQIYSCSNFPLELSINFWISKEKIEEVSFVTEVPYEETVENHLDTYIYMIQKCLIENLSQFDKEET